MTTAAALLANLREMVATLEERDPAELLSVYRVDEAGEVVRIDASRLAVSFTFLSRDPANPVLCGGIPCDTQRLTVEYNTPGAYDEVGGRDAEDALSVVVLPALAGGKKEKRRRCRGARTVMQQATL